MTRARLRALRVQAPHASELRVRRMYEELYGAWPAPTVSVERVRESIAEATTELLTPNEE